MASGVKSVALTAQAALVAFGAPVEDGLEPDDEEEGAFAGPNAPPPICAGTSDFATPAAADLYAARVLGLPDAGLITMAMPPWQCLPWAQ